MEQSNVIQLPQQHDQPQGLDAEWARVEMLAYRLSRQRQGFRLSEQEATHLEALEEQVRVQRDVENPWPLPCILDHMAMDILACVLGPEACPGLGWVYHELQPGVSKPHATPALVMELLGLEGTACAPLFACLAEDGPLRRKHLLRLDQLELYHPIQPGPEFTARCLGRPLDTLQLPGAELVPKRADWQQLVLPAGTESALREFLYWITHRDKVVGEWGGEDVGGPLALFAGGTGTGKTFAASVLATALDWPLYRVDLGKLVSKYIGETEKNINRLFEMAHDRQLVLQFDEADSLFGKRAEVKEGRDRYANMEVSHLLSRVERHRGPCILTTNFRENIDQAFTRRFQVVLTFPRPDKAARERLWNLLLPPGAPLAEEVDVGFLAGCCDLTGGQIRNAALQAAYLAAAEDTPIRLNQIARAVWRELVKDSREITPRHLGPLKEFLS